MTVNRELKYLQFDVLHDFLEFENFAGVTVTPTGVMFMNFITIIPAP